MSEKGTWLVVRLGILLIVGLFTYFGFFAAQECDPIDRVTLYCNLHPFKFLDAIGCILFYSMAAVLAGVPKFFGYDPELPTGAAIGVFALGVLSIILIYA